MRPFTRLAIIWVLVRKDLSSFARDKMWVLLTPFSIAFVVIAFWLAPDKVDDSVSVGVFPPDSAVLMAALDAEEEDDEGIVIVAVDDEARLVAAVEGTLEDATAAEEDISIGMVFPTNFAEAIAAKDQVEVRLIIRDSVPQALASAFESEVREIAFAMEDKLAGLDPSLSLPVTLPTEDELVVGRDRTGNLVGMRDKLSPMMAILMLMLGSIAIAGLVASEIERRTATALLVTPVTTGDFLAAKGITGAILGVSQAILFLLLTNSLGQHWWAVVGLMVLGALMMSSLGMIAGAAGRDFMSTMFLAIALILPMVIPTFAVLFPGSRSLWVRLMPSWGFVEAMVELLGYGTNPAELLGYIGLSVVWTVALLAIALLLLKRRVEAL
jgi:ABC-2 type transport system permease protein